MRRSYQSQSHNTYANAVVFRPDRKLAIAPQAILSQMRAIATDTAPATQIFLIPNYKVHPHPNKRDGEF